MDELFTLLVVAVAIFCSTQHMLHRNGYYHHTRRRYKYQIKENPRTDRSQ